MRRFDVEGDGFVISLSNEQVAMLITLIGGLLWFERRLAKVETIITMLAARCPQCGPEAMKGSE